MNKDKFNKSILITEKNKSVNINTGLFYLLLILFSIIYCLIVEYTKTEGIIAFSLLIIIVLSTIFLQFKKAICK